MGYVDTPEGRFVHEQLNLGIGECVDGLGVRFTPFVKNGQVVDTRHRATCGRYSHSVSPKTANSEKWLTGAITAPASGSSMPGSFSHV